MFGMGKLLGNAAGSLIYKIGLGGIAPLIKLGLNALTGNRLGVAQVVVSPGSNFKGNFQNNASKGLPLGGIEHSTDNFAAENRNLLKGEKMLCQFRAQQRFRQNNKQFLMNNVG